MSTWIEEGFIAFDSETTGVDTAEDRIVTAAAVLFRDGEPQETRSWLIKVDVDIPERASEVHGITNEISQSQGQDQTEALAEIGDYLDSAGLPIVCFNTGFDIPILNSNLQRHGLGELKTTVIICPYVIDRQFDKYVKGKNQRRLKPTAERYGLELSEDDWHGAEADSLVTGRILIAQAQKFPKITDVTPQELADQVALWRGQQDAEFKEWLARQPPLRQ
jgi:DNA polymerase-3 subunit epsilon